MNSIEQVAARCGSGGGGRPSLAACSTVLAGIAPGTVASADQGGAAPAPAVGASWPRPIQAHGDVIANLWEWNWSLRSPLRVP